MDYLAKIKGILELFQRIPKKFGYLFRVAISVLSFAFIGYKLHAYFVLGHPEDILPYVTGHGAYLVVIVVLLVVPNWILESLKWKILVSPVSELSLSNSLRSVLSAISFSMLTPNRIGEIAGRAFFLPEGSRGRAMMASGVGSMSQALVTFIAGIVSYLVLDGLYGYRLISGFGNGASLVAISLFAALALTFVLLKKAGKLPGFEKYVAVLRQYKGPDLLKVQFLSLARYVLFSGQFFLLLKLFGVNLPVMAGFMAISCTYLLLFVTPFITLAEVGTRGAAAIVCIGHFNDNIAGILLACFALWLINLVLPALAGSIIMLRLKRGFSYLPLARQFAHEGNKIKAGL